MREMYERVVERLNDYAKANGVDDLNLELGVEKSTWIISYNDRELFVNLRDDIDEEYVFQTCLENGTYMKDDKINQAFYT
jgi:tRNA nucleotidyltransferase (CCA-adding enzyme)